MTALSTLIISFLLSLIKLYNKVPHIFIARQSP